MLQILISEVIAALQAHVDELGDSGIMQRKFLKPAETEPMIELPFVIARGEQGEYLGVVMRLP